MSTVEVLAARGALVTYHPWYLGRAKADSLLSHMVTDASPGLASLRACECASQL